VTKLRNLKENLKWDFLAQGEGRIDWRFEERKYKRLCEVNLCMEKNWQKPGTKHTNIHIDIYTMLCKLNCLLRYKKSLWFLVEWDAALNVHFLSFLLKEMTFQN
jgi:hypothetical protein